MALGPQGSLSCASCSRGLWGHPWLATGKTNKCERTLGAVPASMSWDGRRSINSQGFFRESELTAPEADLLFFLRDSAAHCSRRGHMGCEMSHNGRLTSRDDAKIRFLTAFVLDQTLSTNP